jgi:hypothetical protein
MYEGYIRRSDVDRLNFPTAKVEVLLSDSPCGSYTSADLIELK